LTRRYEKRFAELASRGEGAFVPFVVIGDPQLQVSLSIIQTLVRSGADALELGLPFSDPLADGPVIQDAMDRALTARVTPRQCLDLIRQIRQEDQQIPIGLLVYANLVYAFGPAAFYAACHEAGVDSVLVADVPVGESQAFCDAAVQAGIDPILLCPPNVTPETIRQIATKGRGYTYLLSRAGVTGTNVVAGMPVHEILQELDACGAPPPLLGFGISQPGHVSAAIQAGATGVITGSAIVKIIEKHLKDLPALTCELAAFVRSMKAATAASQTGS
jgi:tryptophan synthase alpha chain